MAGPTTQQLSDRFRRDLDRLEETVNRHLHHHEEGANPITELLAKLTTQQAVLEAKDLAREKVLDEVKRSFEKRDRKQWLLWVAVIAALLAFVGNLVVALFRK